jgi:hypothetical protein
MKWNYISLKTEMWCITCGRLCSDKQHMEIRRLREFEFNWTNSRAGFCVEVVAPSLWGRVALSCTKCYLCVYLVSHLTTPYQLSAVIQCVRWLCVNTARSYSWGHSQSQMWHEHGSDSQRLRNYGYLKFKMIWTLRRTSGSFMGLAAMAIRWYSSSLQFTLRSCAVFFM